MTRKATLSLKGLTTLGFEKLAALILEETGYNPAFAKRVKAALAGVQGPDSIARLIERRLAALERARGFIGWDKARDFAADLGAVVDTIKGELGEHHPALGIRLLLRFIDTHPRVFERIDDSNGAAQLVYWRACQMITEFLAKLPEDERDWLPDRLTGGLTKDEYGLVGGIAIAVIPLLPRPALERWDKSLRSGGKDGAGIDVRQAIADARGDVDGYLALENQKSEWLQNPLQAAERLRAVGRLDEALDRIRRKHKELVLVTRNDLAEGRFRGHQDFDKIRLEARILEEMQDRQAAQALRWAAFEKHLDADFLRDYLRKLEDFTEYEEQERAFTVAAASKNVYSALAFFILWPKLDLAAQMVIDRRASLDGARYGILPKAAEALQHDFPLAATILFRALLNEILAKAKSSAYGHGARYLARLTMLAPQLGTSDVIEPHATYLAEIKRKHVRKAGFWSHANGHKE